MFMRMPDEYYDQIPMYPVMPMMRSSHIMPFPKKRECAEEQPVPPGSTGGPTFEKQPGPPVQQDIKYTQGYLTTLLGKYIKVEFLIGTSMWVDREGILTDVGISYIVLKEAGSNDLIMCDLYSIKFVRLYEDQAKAKKCFFKDENGS